MITANEIAKKISGEVVGDGKIVIHNVAKIEESKEGEITFLANPKYEKFLYTTLASVIIVDKNFPTQIFLNKTFVKVSNPYKSIAEVLEIFSQNKKENFEIHSTAIIGEYSIVKENVSIAPFVVIGKNCVIESEVIINSGAVIGDNVSINSNTIIYSNVSIYDSTEIGKNCIIHSGVVIGSDGFGFTNENENLKKVPQVGKVIIEDDVEIGANTTIDRATMGVTRVKYGTKLDNLIQVAHNVVIGKNTVIAAQSGISGSTKIGDNCVIGGQVGFGGHIEIANQTKIGAQSGVTKSIIESGKTYSGYPAKEHRKELKLEALIKKLPELFLEIENLKKKLNEKI